MLYNSDKTLEIATLAVEELRQGKDLTEVKSMAAAQPNPSIWSPGDVLVRSIKNPCGNT